MQMKKFLILYLTILLISLSICNAQQWQNFKGIRLVNNSDTTAQLQVQGSLFYDDVSDSLYLFNGTKWVNLMKGSGGTTEVKAGNGLSVINSDSVIFTGGEINMTLPNNLNIGLDNTVTGAGAKRSNYLFGEMVSITGHSPVRWTTIIGESNSVDNYAATGHVIHNSTILGGYTNRIVHDTLTARNMYSPTIVGGIEDSVIINNTSAVTSSTQVIAPIILGGRSNKVLSSYGAAMGWNSFVNGIGAFAHGFWVNNDFTAPSIYSTGQHSFNFSANSSAQTPGNGALANYSAILGGYDHHIPADATNTVIIGGNSINATPAVTDMVYVPRLTIPDLSGFDPSINIGGADGITIDGGYNGSPAVPNISISNTGGSGFTNQLRGDGIILDDTGKNNELTISTYQISLDGTDTQPFLISAYDSILISSGDDLLLNSPATLRLDADSAQINAPKHILINSDSVEIYGHDKVLISAENVNGDITAVAADDITISAGDNLLISAATLQFSGTIGASGIISNLNYVPTASNLSGTVNNVVPTSFYCQRLGNYVTCHGAITVTTTGTGPGGFNMSIPVASDFNQIEDLVGSGQIAEGTDFITANADITNNNFACYVDSGGGDSFFLTTFQYVIK